MTRLREHTRLIRSKNAGPFHITFDIFIRDPDVYEKLKEENTLNKRVFSEIYQADERAITFVEYDEAHAFKATIPRKHSSGSPKDGDIMGGQQHGPLVDLEVNV